MIRLDIPGLPPSVNAERGILRVAMRKRREFKMLVENAVWLQLSLANTGGLPIGSKAQAVRVEIVYVLGPKRRTSDTFNREKALLDALTTSGVLEDDRWVKIGEVASVWGPEDRTLVKLFTVQAPTLEQVMDWWNLPDPLMEQVMGRLA